MNSPKSGEGSQESTVEENNPNNTNVYLPANNMPTMKKVQELSSTKYDSPFGKTLSITDKTTLLEGRALSSQKIVFQSLFPSKPLNFRFNLPLPSVLLQQSIPLSSSYVSSGNMMNHFLPHQIPKTCFSSSLIYSGGHHVPPPSQDLSSQSFQH